MTTKANGNHQLKSCGGVVHRYLRERKREDESGIYVAMNERKLAARILFLFEIHGVTHVVLGSFGTGLGVFRNSVGLVRRIRDSSIYSIMSSLQHWGIRRLIHRLAVCSTSSVHVFL